LTVTGRVPYQQEPLVIHNRVQMLMIPRYVLSIFCLVQFEFCSLMILIRMAYLTKCLSHKLNAYHTYTNAYTLHTHACACGKCTHHIDTNTSSHGTVAIELFFATRVHPLHVHAIVFSVCCTLKLCAILQSCCCMYCCCILLTEIILKLFLLGA
jgi:hypothetical protein